MLGEHVTQRASPKNDVANMPVKQGWILHYDSTTADIVIRHSPKFLCNVGASINPLATSVKSPAVDTVGGDHEDVVQCERCRDWGDATSSLICDECNKLFHITCVPSPTKLTPLMDEWFCSSSCKRIWNGKLKQKRKKGREIQGAIYPGGNSKLRSQTKIRVGPQHQAIVPEACGVVDEDYPVDALAEDPVSRFGHEVPLTFEEKQLEEDQAKFNLANNIWPRGWLPAKRIPVGINENWLQCTFVLISMGNDCDDGRMADKDIVCGKWRRAPESYKSREDIVWECSDAVVWDPYHADCNVPQEMSDEEIIERLKRRTHLPEMAKRDSEQDL